MRNVGFVFRPSSEGFFVAFVSPHVAAIDGAAFAAKTYFDANNKAYPAGATLAAGSTNLAAIKSRQEAVNAIMNVSSKPDAAPDAYALGADDQASHGIAISAIVWLAAMWLDANQVNVSGVNLAALVANDPKITDAQFVKMFTKLFTVHD